MKPRAGIAATLFATLLCVGCAASLREAPSVEQLAGAPRHEAHAVLDLLERAETLHAERTLESVRQAAALYLEAAAVQSARAEAWVGACRAQVWLSAGEPTAEKREAASLAAVQSAQLCASEAGRAALCDYWLAVGLGVQARERRTTALDALPRIVELLEGSAAIDPSIERGGPHRVLALVLARAPGWPTGPGDPERALEEARAAVEVDPTFVPNQLSLAETLAGMDETEESLQLLLAAEAAAREASERGEPDAREWLAEIESARTSGWARGTKFLPGS